MGQVRFGNTFLEYNFYVIKRPELEFFKQLIMHVEMWSS
jgi:hypothetical protein